MDKNDEAKEKFQEKVGELIWVFEKRIPAGIMKNIFETEMNDKHNTVFR